MADNKTLVVATVFVWLMRWLYVVLPMDMIPDFVPVLGWVDDAFGILAALVFTAYTAVQLARAVIAELATPQVPHRYEPLSVEDIRGL